MILIAAALALAAPACPTGADLPALMCQAVAASDDKKFAEAASAFQGAAALSPASDERTTRLWAAAGNMWIAAGEAGKAAVALDKALAGPGLDQLQRGFAELDRARAAEMQADLKTARAFATKATANIPEDPFVHYFSAALAIRENDLATARAAIAEALKLAPDSAEIQFEAGHVAAAAGDNERARAYWKKAAELDPGGSFAASATKAIALLDKPAPATK